MRLQQLHALRSHHQQGWARVPSRHICIYHTYILHISIYTCPAMQMNTDRHTNTDSTSGLILHSVWAVWRFISSKYVCVCMYRWRSCSDLWMLPPYTHCDHGCKSPPTCGLTPFAGTHTPIDTYTHIRQGVPHPGKYLELEFNEKIGVKCWSTTGHAQARILTSNLLTHGPYASILPYLFLPKPPRTLPFPTFKWFSK